MKDLQYIFNKVLWRIFKFDRECVNNFFRRQGVKIGNNVHINCNILTNESRLIEIHNNVTISHDVQFITHDNSISRVVSGKSNLLGKIIIGDDCFIGARSTLLYGVTLAPKVIVAAGSVVTRSFNESEIVIGGNPAKKLTNYSALAKKYEDKAVSFSGLSKNDRQRMLADERILVKR